MLPFSALPTQEWYELLMKAGSSWLSSDSSVVVKTSVWECYICVSVGNIAVSGPMQDL